MWRLTGEPGRTRRQEDCAPACAYPTPSTRLRSLTRRWPIYVGAPLSFGASSCAASADYLPTAAHSSSSTHMLTMASLMSLTSTRTSDSSGALTFLPAFVPTSRRASPRAYTPTHALPLSMATARDQPEMGSGAARGGSADPGARGGRARGNLQGHKWCSGSAPRCAVPTTPLCAGAPGPDKV